MDYYTVLTDAGRALEAAALAGQKTYTLAICALGDGDGLPDPTRTRLQNEVWRGPINTLAPDVNNPTWLLIETHVPPESGGFTIREFGIYTDDGILFAIGNHPEIYKPTLEEGTGIDLIVRPICAVSNATSVTLLTDPTIVMASKKYVDDRIIYNDADLRATLVPTVRTITTTAPLTGGGALSDNLILRVSGASETALGVVERATDVEASAGTDITRYVTPKHLASLRTTLVPTARTITTTAPLTGGGVLNDNLTLKINEATETALGVVERATDAEAKGKTDATRFVTSKHLGYIRSVLPGEPVYLAGPYLPPNHVWPDRSLILFKDWPELYQRYLDNLLGVAMTATDKANFPGAFAISDDGKGLYLPNLGGYFIRAWRPSQTIDAGRKSGGAQGDAIRNITGTFGSAHIFPFQAASGVLAVAVPGNLQGSPLVSASNLYANITLDASRIVPTAAENRPVNISVPLAIYLGNPA